jgi:4'-phosphopantetheinyl transferase EntD
VIEALFPEGVVVVVATDPLAREPLHPDEAALAVRMGEARRREFALGRACARHALVRLGVPGPVLRGPDRAPVWPQGVVGSLTHCDLLCAAAVARSGDIVAIGLDAETDEPLSPRMGQRVCTEAERLHLARLPRRPAGTWEKLVFSAKESFYKAWYTIARSGLGFRDVEVHVDPGAGGFSARVLRDDKPGPRGGHGRFAFAPPHVVTAVVLLRGDA